jgi:hypothetical protein
LVASQIRDELIDQRSNGSSVAFSLFTGDVGESPGRRGLPGRTGTVLATPLDDSFIHDRWRESIAQPLIDAGIPIFNAVGNRDLFAAETCDPSSGGLYCLETASTHTGTATQWRQSFATMPAPWGATDSKPAASATGIAFEPLDTGGTKVEMTDQQVDDPTKAAGGTTVEDPTKKAGGTEVTDPTGNGLGKKVPESGLVGDQRVPDQGLAGPQKVPTGGAHTHYALDVKRDGKPLMRLVVLDTSLKALAASNANQNPVEEQLSWLKDALQRPAGERAVVLTTTPTYSYGPGASTETETDGTALEAILMQNRVDLVVDGRLGWNALYWALAPGIHWPCPGGAYPSRTPTLADASCSPVGSADAGKAAGDAQAKAAGLTGSQVDSPGALPFLVADTAGGKFGPDGQAIGSASNGYWRGYSIIRLDTESGQIRVEQRPVFDWIGIRVPPGTRATHVLRPGQSTDLEGFGREPLGIDVGPRYDEIETAAITHCWDLVLADPKKLWLPLMAEDASTEQLAAPGPGCRGRLGSNEAADPTPGENRCDPYVCAPSSIGTIDDQSGVIAAGNESHDRTFAIAILSVGQKVASYPISFEPRPSFTPEAPPPPPPPSSPPPPPPPPPPPGNQLPQINLPAPPAIPSLPIDAGLVPPVPPGLPPPPGASSATPLNLFLSTPGINLSPQSTVVPPPAPPIQPAPPGGARKEARQKQAATQDSGADSSGDEKSSDAAGDLAQDGLDRSMTRRAMPESGRESMGFSRADRTRPGQSFTTLSARAHRGDSTPTALYIGGITLLALTLALGYTHARPTPRRRTPELPAPAYARSRHRRR